MSDELEPPYLAILKGLQEGTVIPFLGSGASLGDRDPEKTPWVAEKSDNLPTASELSSLLASAASFPKGEMPDLAKVAQYYTVAIGRPSLYQKLRSVFDVDYAPLRVHEFLASLTTPLLIVTTNYDDLVERAFQKIGRPFDVVTHTTDPKLGDRILWWPHGENTPHEVSPNKAGLPVDKVTIIYKMHGAVVRTEASRDQYVITEDDYIDFLARMMRKKAIPAMFAEPFQQRQFLFLGYGLRDWNLRVVLNRIGLRKETEGNKSWAIQNHPSALERRFWQDRGVEVYDMNIDDFLKKLPPV